MYLKIVIFPIMAVLNFFWLPNIVFQPLLIQNKILVPHYSWKTKYFLKTLHFLLSLWRQLKLAFQQVNSMFWTFVFHSGIPRFCSLVKCIMTFTFGEKCLSGFLLTYSFHRIYLDLTLALLSLQICHYTKYSIRLGRLVWLFILKITLLMQPSPLQFIERNIRQQQTLLPCGKVGNQ